MYGTEESLYVAPTFTKVDVMPNNIVRLPIVGDLRTGITYPIKVTTKVTDQDGNPLEGVHLYLKSNPTAKGAITNANGDVTIEGIEFDDDLEFSYLGTKLTKMAGSILPTTQLIVEGWSFPETIVSAPAKKSNAWLWLLGLAVIGTGFYFYKNSQSKKYIKAKL